MENNEKIVKNWNKVATKKDIIYHLGDVANTRKDLEVLRECNGIKHLILGNHDQYNTEVYRKYFNRIRGVIVLKGDLLLTHVPIHPQAFIYYATMINIHGHIHNKDLQIKNIQISSYYLEYKNVMAEMNDFKLVSFDEIKE